MEASPGLMGRRKALPLKELFEYQAEAGRPNFNECSAARTREIIDSLTTRCTHSAVRPASRHFSKVWIRVPWPPSSHFVSNTFSRVHKLTTVDLWSALRPKMNLDSTRFPGLANFRRLVAWI